MSNPVNKYKVVYGSTFLSSRTIWAHSEGDVLEYCQKKFPNIFPIREIILLEEDVDLPLLTQTHN